MLTCSYKHIIFTNPDRRTKSRRERWEMRDTEKRRKEGLLEKKKTDGEESFYFVEQERYESFDVIIGYYCLRFISCGNG